MSTYVSYRDGGKTTEEGLFKWLSRLFTGGNPTTYLSTSLKVVQRGAGANMSVDVSVGDVHIPYSTYSLYGWIDAAENKTVTAADGTNPRKDIVVAYVDLAVVDDATDNNLGALKFAIVAGTPAGSPSDPSDGDISTAVSGNPYKKLARLTIPAGVTSVVDAYITDIRSPIAFRGRLWGGSSNTDGHTIPNAADDTVALLNATQTLTAKTLTAPKLVDGGFIADDSGNEVLKISKTASAVNEFTVANAATAGLPTLSVTGGDTDISMRTKAKGAGTVQHGRPVAFHAYRNASKTIGASPADVVHDTILFDYGSNFNTTTGVFTAPYAGVYFFNTNLAGANATRKIVYFVCSTAGTFKTTDIEATTSRSIAGTLTIALAASETVKVQGYFAVNGDAAATDTWFAGYLIGRTD